MNRKAYDVPDEDSQLLRRLQTLGATASPLSTRERAWQETLASIGPSQDLSKPSMHTSGNAQTGETAVSLNGRAPVKPAMPQIRELPDPRSLSRWKLLSLAAALLVMLAIGAGYFALGPGRDDGDDIQVIPAAIPSPESFQREVLDEEMLFTIALPGEELPYGDQVASSLSHNTLPPGAEARWDGTTAAKYPGSRIDYVLEGTLTIRAEGPVRVVRGGGNGDPETVPANTDITLEPGDMISLPVTTSITYTNSGDLAVEMLNFNMYDDIDGMLMAAHPQGWLAHDGAEDIRRGLTVPPGAATFELRRLTLAANSSLTPPPGVIQYSLRLPANALGTPTVVGDVGRWEGGVHNVSDNPATLYVLTVELAPDAGGTPAPG
jgi:hypothetical protein